MGRENATRKLTAILYADVAGYSRLTGADEEGTHNTVADYLDAISGMISSHDGRVVHYAGDAVLADFPSVVAAVKCAIDVQRCLAARNADIPDKRKVQFRIGVNLGDVIVDRDDIYGNGVNVAARLESLADPGGICVSSSVLEQVQGKVDVTFQDMGPKDVKNIAKAVQVFRVDLEKQSTVTAARPSPQKPSIAVLPFDTIGSDTRTRDLADGLTEDLITALAKVQDLFVIDRHSTESFKGRSVKLPDVAKSLSVRYVFAGSIQIHSDKLRCSVQFVDTVDGRHLWAERYDRSIEDIFELQDEIVWHILLELQVRLTDGDSARIASRGTRNLEAWLLRAQGAAELSRFTREGNIRARELFEAAHQADPNWSRPLAGIAYSHYFEARWGWGSSSEDAIARGIEFAEGAIAMNSQEPLAYMALRGLNLLLGDYDKALSFVERGVAVAPNDHLAVGTLAAQLTYMEETERAIEVFERAARLGPTTFKMYQRVFGIALQFAGCTDRAITILEELAQKEPEWSAGLAQLAAAYADAGRVDAAKATVKKVLETDPAYTASRYLSIVHFQNPERTEWLRALLIKAGLPE